MESRSLRCVSLVLGLCMAASGIAHAEDVPSETQSPTTDAVWCGGARVETGTEEWFDCLQAEQCELYPVDGEACTSALPQQVSAD